ncbi:MAG: hypothetical protein NVS86_01090 [Candidatus Carsonella ruddii]|nr:MAG: hypothetical protein NVS86_01090 [Candidatus Carsonella ruddii]
MKKHFLSNNFKYFKIGTNSKNCFFKQKKNYYFYSLIINNYLKIYNIKIFQNKLNIFLTKIIFNYKNNIFYKKINGFMFFFSKKNICLKLSFLISIFKKKKKKKIFFNFFLIKNKNYISKFFYFCKKKKILSNIFSHNDIFKDNVLILGNFISSLIDLNNYSFLKLNNDLSNLILEFTENFYFKKITIIEIFLKKKKFFFLNIRYYILKMLIYRKKKLNLKRKTKIPKNYIKKSIFL